MTAVARSRPTRGRARQKTRRPRGRGRVPGGAGCPPEQPVYAETGEHREGGVGGYESELGPCYFEGKTRLIDRADQAQNSRRCKHDQRHVDRRPPVRFTPGSAMPRPILRGWLWASGRYRLLPMRITVLPGIWPPDVGGPATHAPELARFLTSRGHSVHVVTMASAPPTERPCRVTTIDRGRPFPFRYGELTVRATTAVRRV